MELKEYVKNVLTEVAQGVSEAINESEGKGYLVNPVRTPSTQKGVVSVKFHVSVTSGTEGSVGIKIAGVEHSTSSENTIDFEVPVMLPVSYEHGNSKPPERKYPISQDV